jgi:DNA segregation ATPase FtsK/SpoIIIE, S-DNA-T family
MAKSSTTTRKATTNTRQNTSKSRTTNKRGAKTASPDIPLFPFPKINIELVLDALGAVITVLGLLTGLAMLPSDQPSSVQPWLDVLAYLFGTLDVAIPFLLMGIGVWLVVRRFVNNSAVRWYRPMGAIFFAIALFGLLGVAELWEVPVLLGNVPVWVETVAPRQYGGAIGLFLGRGFIMATGKWGAVVLLAGLGVVGALYLFELSLAEIAQAFAQFRAKAFPPRPVVNGMGARSSTPSNQMPLPNFNELFEQTVEFWSNVRSSVSRQIQKLRPVPADDNGTDTVAPFTSTPKPAPAPAAAKNVAPSPASAFQPDMTWGTTSQWRLPPWHEYLESREEGSLADEDVRRKTHTIEETLREFGVPARVIEINRGPTVTQFGVEPGFLIRKIRGEEKKIKVKVSAITNLQNDLALALAAPRIRMEAPVPGRNYVGIEVPNDKANAVTLKDVMTSDEFQGMRAGLRLALGRDVMGNAVAADLGKMPHLLIAGATGSGKSVCINTVVASLICQNTPDQLRLLMVDPKRVELINYNGIPHLITPVVVDFERVVGSLTWAVAEMERRYRIFSQQGVRNLAAFNARAYEKGERPLPHIVIIIDELADLMMAAGPQVEALICRLAQMARATGMHLIIATQRPSVDVVTGLIKANFPSRIAFAVTSQIDSRVILDRPGAESLLGRGDMLYQASDSGVLVRAQGCFVGDRELEKVTEYWQEQAKSVPAKPSPTPATAVTYVEPTKPLDWDELLKDDSDEEDDLLPKAREVVAQAGTASVSMLQRKLRVGFARAARIIDLLEAEGTIGSGNGPGKNREVLANGSATNEDDEEEDFFDD